MNQMTFVWAAYAVTLGGTVLVTLWAWASMRRAEKAAQR
jgi:heme exporter protein D